MHDHLPPDLARLGDQLAAATARAGARQQRRKKLLARLGATGAAAALALGVFAPGILHPSDGARTLALAAASASFKPTACDQPRGATFAAARPCAAPGTTDATPDRLARRLAVH
jgi:hypothetical protein